MSSTDNTIKMSNNNDLEERIDGLNKKIKTNSKLLLTTCISTILPGKIPKGLDFEDIKYFIITTTCFLAYAGYSNLYRENNLKEGELLTSGVYGIHRHPENTGEIGMAASCSAMAATAFYNSNNYISAGLSLLAFGLFVRQKELRAKKFNIILEDQFGDEFREYQKNVPKYVPNPIKIYRSLRQKYLHNSSK